MYSWLLYTHLFLYQYCLWVLKFLCSCIYSFFLCPMCNRSLNHPHSFCLAEQDSSNSSNFQCLCQSRSILHLCNLNNFHCKLGICLADEGPASKMYTKRTVKIKMYYICLSSISSATGLYDCVNCRLYFLILFWQFYCNRQFFSANYQLIISS